MSSELRNAVADWLQILSAPITFAGAYGVWHVERRQQTLTENQATALLMLVTIAVWVFLFSSYWRVTIKFASPVRDSKPFTAGAVFLVSGVVGWLLFFAFELYVTEAMLRNPGSFDQLLWIGLPSIAWFGMSFILYMAHGTES